MTDALSPLRALQFFDSLPQELNAAWLDWLLLEDSMTRRFEQHCSQVTVRIVREAFVLQEECRDEAALLPPSERYWLREIILCGDDEPWLLGRTVVPESTLNGPELALQGLGNTPLGRYLFSSSSLTRDYIQIGCSEALWGRRSRLRLSDKPLMLTELFLPHSPLYREER
ncbi:chorismate lyase [Citrobacter sp. JGM124]|uniref:chorismate lyase n=1 Tax=Citrobacter sp. JGM124 TaxID=2799789 RepID=UPI001BAAF246|nr:chorismate lyase [Citrobacter sp. JGM124]MBS0849816.1 chorismate lyase [Citrobacter sp. JGM124]